MPYASMVIDGSIDLGRASIVVCLRQRLCSEHGDLPVDRWKIIAYLHTETLCLKPQDHGAYIIVTIYA